MGDQRDHRGVAPDRTAVVWFVLNHDVSPFPDRLSG
jgi:hypothetical protein